MLRQNLIKIYTKTHQTTPFLTIFHEVAYALHGTS